ncbi:MAG: hypothetical protein HQK83_06195 [Fibrobacteria bacterium]|nr:hypothetical protein [Fibrobacteria bacterium]
MQLFKFKKPAITYSLIGILTLSLHLYAKVSTEVVSDWEKQYSELQQQISQKKTLAKSSTTNSTIESQVYDKHSLILDEDNTPTDVAIRRTRALIDNLKNMPGIKDLTTLEAELDAISAQRSVLAKNSGTQNTAADQEQYKALAKITREAALSNPLLDFDDLLFMEWTNLFSSPQGRDPGDDYDGQHMVDQQYGHNGMPSSEMCILKNFKSDNPTLVEVLEGVKCPPGLSGGMNMSDGAFSDKIDLSWDGDTILFAWSNGEGIKGRWKRERNFHLFKVNVDGTNLMRLTGNEELPTGNGWRPDGMTDNETNDFHPAWLPNGRIVFMSTWGNGNGRCHGRWAPTYNMHTIKSDGTDRFQFDWQETNEWYPSVNNDGMIIYSRWDYIDRSDCIAHHLWICYPDGRDPRAPHGNYPLPLTTLEGSDWPHGQDMRPNAEMQFRAIPGSNKLVATATPHHGQAFGSIIIVDPNIEDDNVMSQVKRLTPDAIFPEAESFVYHPNEWVYGHPWPLSEDYFIVNKWQGLYLLDKFGNQTLIYKTTRNSWVRPVCPIPVKPRTKPPVIPTQTYQGERFSSNAPNATIYVNNVYVTDEFGSLPEEYGPEPGKKKIKWMRIIQLLHKESQAKNDPDIAPHASESLVRIPLGVCPVEDDGSVYCEAPVERLIYFQLLNEEGLAVQSMRSGTYVHPGEQLSCVGCHENKWEAPPITPSPIAKRRSPSPLEPEVDTEHIWPFGYYRTAKPVFDAKCTPCHQEKGQGPSMSYESIKSRLFGFSGDIWTSYNLPKWGGSRTKPGKFGAMYSSLTPYLEESHYNPGLTDEEKRRITLWLDLQSNKYHAYFDVADQEAGKKVWPVLLDTNNILGVERRVVPIAMPENQNEKQPTFHVVTNGKTANIILPARKVYTITIYSIAGTEITSFRTGKTSRFTFSTERFSRGVYAISARSESAKQLTRFAITN